MRPSGPNAGRVRLASQNHVPSMKRFWMRTAGPWSRRTVGFGAALGFGVALLFAGGAVPAAAQTIEGVLMEAQSDRPISLGLIIMMTTEGDSITSAVTNSAGRFTVDAEEPGDFYLIASAFGFKETRVGVFELGQGGSMEIEFRVGAEAMPIEGILVELQRPALPHQLITNGFVRRLQRGLGLFVTPYDIEESLAMTTADLFRGMPGVSIRPVAGNLGSFRGDMVQMMSANGYCTPTVYLDGQRLSPGVVRDNSLGDLVPLNTIDAAEVYRRPSEIPIEYAATGSQSGAEFGTCGVLVLWTKGR